MIWHIQVRLKQITALVNGIYKCDYIAAFIFLDLQVRVDQMRHLFYVSALVNNEVWFYFNPMHFNFLNITISLGVH